MRRIFVSAIFIFTLLIRSGMSYGGEYFSCDGIDHFRTESECEQKQRANESKETNQDRMITRQDVEMWGEPSVDADGRVISKVPPEPVLRLLKDPTPENAAEYLEWGDKRIEAIQKAQAVVSALSQDRTDKAGPAVVIEDPKKIRSASFFFGPTCPYSMQQVAAVESLAKKIGYEKVTAIPTSTDVALIKEFINKTGMTLKLSVDQAVVAKNNITSVPVTIIDYAGNLIRFDGYTEDFFKPGTASQQGAQSGCSQH